MNAAQRRKRNRRRWHESRVRENRLPRPKPLATADWLALMREQMFLDLEATWTKPSPLAPPARPLHNASVVK